MARNGKGALLALGAFGVYATHDALVKLLGAEYSPFQLLFFSVLFSFPLATAMMVRDTRPGTLVPVHPGWIAVRSAATVVTGLAAFYAFSVLPLAQTYAIVFAQPLLITLMAIPLLGERVGPRRAGAVVVGLLGVLVVLRPGGGTELGLGHLAALTAAVAGALGSVIVRKVGQEERPIILLVYPMLANLVVMGLALPFVYRPMEAEHMGLIAVLSSLGWLGGVIIIAAYRAAPAVTVAPMQYSQILWATLYGTLFFGESVDGATAVGTGIIVASGLYIVLREETASSQRPVTNSRLRPETASTPRASVLGRLAGVAPRGDRHATPCE